MQFQITDVEFDFTDCFTPSFYDQDVIDDVIGNIWEACDEDDLIEEITAATGWCIKSIDYVHVLT